MRQAWRWFGPSDKVTLADARQAGAEAIVTALHEIPIGAVWPVEAIRARQDEVRRAGLEWTVVESLDVSERIKLREPGYAADVSHYILCLKNLAACGIHVVAYNFMPIFSWLRTDLQFPLATGGTTLRFSNSDFAVFDLCMLGRPGAEEEWGEEATRAAWESYGRMLPAARERLLETILQGLPGGNGTFTLDELRVHLDRYRGVSKADFQSCAASFLKEICPAAEEVGVRLCIHPDDPPRDLLGLPRIVSTEDDLAYLLEQWPGTANGITFCAGALGARADNHLVSMIKRFAQRIWFAHLRSVQREADGRSFFEAAHLEGDSGLIDIVRALLAETRRRRDSGDIRDLPFRPDHGQQLQSDAEREAHAGYPAIGRLRGLAELRGVIQTIQLLSA